MINMRDEKHETRDQSLSLVGQAGLASEQGVPRAPGAARGYELSVHLRVCCRSAGAPVCRVPGGFAGAFQLLCVECLTERADTLR